MISAFIMTLTGQATHFLMGQRMGAGTSERTLYGMIVATGNKLGAEPPPEGFGQRVYDCTCTFGLPYLQCMGLQSPDF